MARSPVLGLAQCDAHPAESATAFRAVLWGTKERRAAGRPSADLVAGIELSN